MTTPKSDTITEIEDIDSSIDLLREPYLRAKGKARTRYETLINRLLDDRLVAMKARDSKTDK